MTNTNLLICQIQNLSYLLVSSLLMTLLMVKKNSQTFSLEIKNFKEVYDYCYLNQIIDMNYFVTKCFKQGFDIQKYGMLGEQTEVKEVIKEVEKIVEVPVEKIVEIVKEIPGPTTEIEVVKYVDREVVKEVPVEKIVKIYDNNEPQIIEKEIIKEVIKEVPVEGSDEKTKMLQTTLHNLRKELQLKNTKINELEDRVRSLEGQLSTNVKALFMKGSNLNDTL